MKKLLIILFLLVGIYGQDSTNVTQLSTATSLADGDYFLVDQSDSTRNVTWLTLKALANADFLAANNNWTGTNTFGSTVTINGALNTGGINTFGSTTIINGDITSTGSNTWSGANDFTGTLTADEITLDYYVDVTAPTNSYRVGGTTVLGLTTLGSTVVNSSLESVDTLSAGWISPGFGDINIGLSNFTSDGLVGTSDFISRMTGWRIDGDGNADFRYIWADELHVEAFIADISQALAGSDFLTKSVAILSRNFTIPDSGNSALLYVEDLPGFPDTRVFESGDWIRLRVIDRSVGLIVADVWGTVTGYLDLANGEQSWSFKTEDAGGSAGLGIYEGSLVLDYGVSGDGFIERTVLDAAGSPYTRVATWTSNPSIPSNYSLKMQYGSLDGITDPDFGALSGFGYYAVDNIYIKGVIKALEGGEIGGYDIYNTKLETTNAILQGGTAPYFKIWKDASTDYIDMHYNSISDWGLIGKVNNGTLFQLGSANKIAGWNFNSSQFSSTNLSGGSDGAFTTSGIALNSSGWLSAPNFALGTVSSKIAGWNFDSEKLYKISDVNSNNKFALNLSATPIIGASQTGFEVYDIDNPKIFVGTKDISGLPSRGFDYNITSSGDFTVRGNFSTRSDIGNDDGIYITDWHIYNRQLSGGLSLESYLNPYQLRFAVDGIEKLRLGDINGLQVYGIKTNGNLTLNIEDMIPYLPYTSSIGSVNKKFLSLHVGEIQADVLVAQEVAATIGGRIVVGPSNILIRDCHVGDTFIEVKYNNFSNGDIIYFEGMGITGPQVEFMRITSDVYIIDGKYRYNVARNLDNTSENGWYAGDGCTSTGVAGKGWIDMYSTSGMKTTSQYGPTIVGNIRNSSTWNDWSEVWAIGNLTNLYNQPGGTVGVGLGKYASGSNHIVITPSTGINFFDYNTNIAQWSGSTIRLGQTGVGKQNLIITPSEIAFYNNATQVAKWSGSTVTLGEVGAGKSNLLISSGALKLRNNTTDFITLNADGTGTFAGNITSSATITGGTIQTAASGQRVVLGAGTPEYVAFYSDLTYKGGLGLNGIGNLSLYGQSRLIISSSSGVVEIESSVDATGNIAAIGHLQGSKLRIGFTDVIDASRNASFVGLTNSGKTVHSASTVTSGTTIDVSGKTYIELNYSASTIITNFTSGMVGQRIVLVKVGGAIVTIRDGTNIMLEGSANRVLATDDSMVLIYTSNGYWVEEGTDN